MKRLFITLMCILLVFCYMPVMAFADVAEVEPSVSDDTHIYVSSRGSDDSGNGTQENPYATLEKAAAVVNGGDDANYIVHVLSDLTSTKCARFYNKNVTIVGEGETAPVVTRGDEFRTISDNARSWYNPAMIEVGGTKTDGSEDLGKATLRLKNIILDDAGKHMGTKFAFASTDGTGGNGEYVQDAIIASYNGTGTIILDEGATLKNFGGMTAVYVTGSGKLIMKNGSTICDDENFAASNNRDKNYSILLIGATLEMEEGSSIQNIKNALAVNSEGAKCFVNGLIKGIDGKGNPLVRVVGSSEFTLGKTGVIENNITNNIATAYIHSGSVAHIYGKIIGNKAPAGALFIVTNGESSYGYLYDGAEVINNESTGKYGVIEVQQGECTFTMNGGTISGNKAAKAGAIQVRKGNAKFIMNGGVVDNNELLTGGTGDAGVYATEGGNLTIELNKGTLQSISIDKDLLGKKSNGHVYIAEGFNLKTGYLTTRQDRNKSIAPSAESLDIKLSNASPNSINALNEESSAKGWSEPFATFWMQHNGAATMTVGGLNKTIDEKLPVYVMALPVGEDGNPVVLAEKAVATSSKTSVYAADVTENGITFTVPEGNDNGYAIALVQPTADFGNVVITTTKSQIDKNNDKNADGTYEIPYTATYNMPKNLEEIIEANKESISDDNCKFTFTVELDKRLTAKSEAKDYKFTSPIFELKEFTVTDSGSTVTAECKLKADWKEHINELSEKPMVLEGTGVLAEKDFTVGDTINTTGYIEVSISTDSTDSAEKLNSIYVYVPGNVCRTLMVEETVPVGPVGPTVTFYSIRATAGEGGAIAPSGYVSVLEGTDKTFVITPAEGYEIKDVLVDGTSVGAVSEYTFNKVYKNHTIDVTFQTKKEEPQDPDKPDKPEKPTKPTKPAKPANPDKPAKPDADVPKTGDNAPDVLLISLFMLTLSSLAGTLFWKRRSVKK